MLHNCLRVHSGLLTRKSHQSKICPYFFVERLTYCNVSFCVIAWFPFFIEPLIVTFVFLLVLIWLHTRITDVAVYRILFVADL